MRENWSEIEPMRERETQRGGREGGGVGGREAGRVIVREGREGVSE